MGWAALEEQMGTTKFYHSIRKFGGLFLRSFQFKLFFSLSLNKRSEESAPHQDCSKKDTATVITDFFADW